MYLIYMSVWLVSGAVPPPGAGLFPAGGARRQVGIEYYQGCQAARTVYPLTRECIFCLCMNQSRTALRGLFKSLGQSRMSI